MICKNCKEEVNKVTTIYLKGKRIEFCKHCANTLDLPIGDNKEYLKMSSEANCTIAHLKDIKSRKTDYKTGEVYHVRNRTFFY